MIQLLTQGHYLSQGKDWIDWHAGHEFKGTNYYYLKLFSDGRFLHLIRNRNDFDIYSYLAAQSEHALRENTGVTYGRYFIISNKEVEFRYTKIGIEGHFIYTILSPEILLDKNLLEYHFIPKE